MQIKKELQISKPQKLYVKNDRKIYMKSKNNLHTAKTNKKILNKIQTETFVII